jgi:hypothetical protein
VSDFDRAALDRPYAQQPETRAAAARYIVRKREDFAELLMALGLACDPAADEKRMERAMAAIHGSAHREFVNCTTCKRNMWLVWNGVCKRNDCAEVGERKRAGGAR